MSELESQQWNRNYNKQKQLEMKTAVTDTKTLLQICRRKNLGNLKM